MKQVKEKSRTFKICKVVCSEIKMRTIYKFLANIVFVLPLEQNAFTMFYDF